MFIKHGSPEPISYIINNSDTIDEMAKEKLELAKKKSENTKDLTNPETDKK